MLILNCLALIEILKTAISNEFIRAQASHIINNADYYIYHYCYFCINRFSIP
ncbi:hypothetical protein BMS3Abin15_00478 [bacterium BMS3Abin15]|nr:hypothetical protein BMS3Abin15_00478 [bacterium BMS3Abin15]